MASKNKNKHEKIQISGFNKKGKRILITINKKNLSKYKKFNGGYTKNENVIKILKTQKTKRTEKEIKRIKEIKKEEKTSIKKVKNCGFNYKSYYKGINHDGYVRINELAFIITEDTTAKEFEVMEKILMDFIEKEYHILKCPQRMNYSKLHYRVQTGSMGDQVRDSSNTTQISYDLKTLRKRTLEIFDIICKLVHSYLAVNIYRQEFVNIEFNSILKATNNL